jgi:hypothetical protein
MRWAAHAAHVEETRNPYKISAENLKGRDQSEGVYGRIILE